MTWVWEHSRAQGSALLLHLKIADHANDDGRDCYAGQDSLARSCRVATRTVRRLIDELVQAGEVTVEEYGGPRSDRRGRRTHRYSLPRYIQSLEDKVSANDSPVRIAGHPEPNCRTSEAELPDTAMSGEPSVLNHPEPSVSSLAPAAPESTDLEPVRTGKPKGGWARIDGTHALYLEAEVVAADVWENVHPRPPVEYTMLRGIVARFLDSGWAAVRIRAALERTRAYTIPAITFELTSDRGTYDGPSPYQTIMEQFRREEGIG